MSGIKYFQIYLDCKKHIDMLSDEQAGKLFKALFDFSISGKVPEFSDGMLMMCFSFLSAQIERDTAKYKEKCERNRQTALEREKNRRERNSTNVHESHQEKEKEEKNENEEEEKEKENEKEKKEKSDRSQIESDFEECWSIYPKKQGKSSALQSYIKSAEKDGNLKEKVIAGINNYLEYIRQNKTDFRFIKQGSTYFSSECWNDEYTAVNYSDGRYSDEEYDDYSDLINVFD